MTWAGDWLGGEPTEDNDLDETQSAPVTDTTPAPAPSPEAEAEATVDEVPALEDALVPLAPPSAVLIAGVAGGVGATTTAIGLARALGTELVTTAAVDTTPPAVTCRGVAAGTSSTPANGSPNTGCCGVAGLWGIRAAMLWLSLPFTHS